MTERLLLGIDVGTTQVKGAVFNLDGRQRAAAAVTYPLHRPHPGWAEQDPEDWWRATLNVIARIGEQAPLREVAALGVCSQVNTHVLLDAAGRALLPAITWQDQRCAEIAAALDGSIDARRRAELWDTEFPLDASFALSRAAWLARERPREYERARWLLSPKDYVNLRLCGHAAADPFSSIGLVRRDGAYNAGVLALVDGAAGLMAPLHAPDAPLGHVASAARTGLPENAVVATATMDAWASLHGSGVQAPGDAFEVAGTSEILGVLSERARPTPGVVTFPPWHGLRLHAGPTQAAGAALHWFAAAQRTTIDDVLASVTSAMPGSGGLVFLPHLAGERAPLWNPNLRGVFLGLGTEHGFAELSRAVLEGVAYSARHIAEALAHASGHRLERLALSGGGAHSDIWSQIKADVLGRELRRLRVLDSGVLGAALLAGVAAGLLADPAEAASSMVHVERSFEPDVARGARYERLYEVYRSLHPLLEGPFTALAAAR